jgi:hypothetical protein
LDSITTSNGILNYCGTRIYTLLPNFAFLTISGTTMSLSTTSVGDVGVHGPISLTVSLQSYPRVATITKIFYATISCLVQTLAFVSAPAALSTVQVGIVTQPFSIAFTITQIPACGNTVAFALSSPPTFMSLPNITLTGGNIQIFGATLTNLGTYS